MEVDGDEEDAVREAQAMNVRHTQPSTTDSLVQEPTVRKALTVATSYQLLQELPRVYRVQGCRQSSEVSLTEMLAPRQ